MGAKDARNPGSRDMLPGFATLQEVIAGEREPGKFIHVTGCVTRVLLPIKASGNRQNGGGDYKMSAFLTDKSTDETGQTVCLNIFLPDIDSLPTFQLADVLIIKDVLLQAPGRTRDYSLLLRPQTCIHIYRAHPSEPSALRYVPWAAPPKNGRLVDSSKRTLSATEQDYALYLHKHINKNALPDITTFEQTARQSMQVRDRPRELKDANVGLYCDLLVQVVSEPQIRDNSSATLCVSDYTENSLFEVRGSPEGTALANNIIAEVGDTNGYLTKFGNYPVGANGTGNGMPGNYGRHSQQWHGPPGRRCMDVVCFPPHAQYIREQVKLGSWVTMKSVFIKSSDAGLEGVMYTDANRGSPLCIALYKDKGLDLESLDPRYVAALSRKRDLDKAAKKAATKKRRSIQAAAAVEQGTTVSNRMQRRLLTKQGGSECTVKVTKELHNQPLSPLRVFLEPSLYRTDKGIDGGEESVAGKTESPIELPFRNIKIKAQVRVVDFLPRKLFDFAVRVPKSEYAILGKDDNSSDSNSSEDEESDQGEGGGDWEWRFALLLEDASQSTMPATDDDEATGKKETSPARVWALVDNFQGRTLLNESACDLRTDLRAVGVLREKMSLLWGNLLDVKLEARRRARAAHEAEQKQREQNEAQQAPKEQAKKRLDQARERVAVNSVSMALYPQPANEDSDKDELSDVSTPRPAAERQTREQQTRRTPASETETAPEVHRSQPFVCGLQQYGYLETVPGDSDDENGRDGRGRRKKVWRRTVGMFGTLV